MKSKNNQTIIKIKSNELGFTLVELIVVITILAILWTIAFISLQWYSAQARDSKRLSDISNIKKSLELFSLNTWKYPLPDNKITISYSWEPVRYQWYIWEQVSTNLSRNLNEKPIDPLTEWEYIYSTTYSQTEYEVLGLYESDLIWTNVVTPLIGVLQSNAEGQDYPKIDWNYNWIYIKTANFYVPTPSIINAEIVSNDDLSEDNIKSQVVSGGDNIPLMSTWRLNITLSVYTWTIVENSTDEEKIALLEKLKTAYSWSQLASDTIYADILSRTSTWEMVDFVDIVVLNRTVYNNTVSSTDSEASWNDDYTKLLIHSNINNSILLFNDSFDWNELNNDLWIERIRTWDPSIEVNNWTVKFNCDSDDFILINSLSQLSGDFDFQIDFLNINPQYPSSWWVSLEYKDIRDSITYNTLQINRNQTGYLTRIFNNTSLVSASNWTSATSWTFRVVRTWNNVNLYVDEWSWWQLLQSGTTDWTSVWEINFYAGNANVEFDNLIVNSWNFINYTKFNDDSSTNNTITTVWNTHHTVLEKQFWATSIYFDWDWDYLSIPDSDDWDFGTEDFTIDFWVKANAVWQTYNSVIFGKFNDARFLAPLVLYMKTGTYNVVLSSANLAQRDLINEAVVATLVSNTWSHITITRHGDNVYAYQDWTLKSTSNIGDISLLKENTPILIWGGNWTWTYLNWYIDEIRISKWIARTQDPNDYMYDPEWDGFTTPTVPYWN